MELESHYKPTKNKTETEIQEVEIFNGENKYIIGSGTLFLIPAIYAARKKQYLLSTTLFIGPTVSSLFWVKPRMDFWRLLDIIYANTVMGIFIANTAWRIPHHLWEWKIAIPSIYSAGAILFGKACIEHHKRNKNWFFYHIGFHLLMLTGHSANVLLV
jgi:hypothetical protein